MANQYSITPQEQPESSMNFSLLREAGLRHIEKLSSQLWTDYNSHDPGITMLEVLCYAITDLGYHTEYDIKDILSSFKVDASAGEPASSLFAVTDILPSHPFTAKDYRKLLIDNKAIRNVWLYPVLLNIEPKIYLDLKYALDSSSNPPLETYDPELTYEASYDNMAGETVNNELVTPLGLYEIQVEFEEDDDLDDINSNLLQREIDISTGPDPDTYEIEIAFPYWGAVSEEWRTAEFGTEILELGTFIVADRSGFDEYYLDYFANMTSPNLGELLSPISVKLRENLRESVEVNNEIWDFHVNFLDWHEVVNLMDDGYSNIDDVQLILAVPPDTNWDGDIDQTSNIITWENKNVYLAQVKVTLSSSQEVPIQLKITFENDLPKTGGELTFFVDAIKDKIQGPNWEIITKRLAIDEAVKAKLIETTSTGFTEPPFEEYQKRLNRINEILYAEGGIYQKIMAHRNLCEDFHKFAATGVEEIAICGEFILSPQYDPDAVMAEVFFRVDQFLSPIIQFKSLAEMLDLGHSLDEIFEGPLLESGFLPDESLDTLQRKNTIFTSDLINIIMDVKGVIAVNGFKISNYINNRLYNNNAVNCISLAEPISHKPKLSIDKSVVTISTNNVGITPNIEDIKDIFEEKKQVLIDYEADTDYALAVPTGSNLDTEDYVSIQHHFPLVYGIGDEGLPSSAAVLRQAQAKQLKGYLLFFEHLLASYLSQLTNVKALFSTDENIAKSYFSQVLNGIPDISDLYNVLYDEANLQAATETEEVFWDRRNRFLDHLAGRFGEEFSEYALLMYARNNATPADLIEDKINFLQDYPALSKNRGAAFNYKRLKDTALINPPQLDPDVWDTDNVSGFEHRVARLLGIDNYQRRNLFSTSSIIEEVSPNSYRFSIFDGTDLLMSSNPIYTMATMNDLGAAINFIFENGMNDDFYGRADDNGTDFYYFINDAEGNELIRSPNFTTVMTRKTAIDAARDFFENWAPEEGFHLLEHILLRPKYKDIDDGTNSISDTFLQVDFEDPEIATKAQKDPYSFKMSLILPNVPRFRDVVFRNYINRTLRLETPAHIYVEIYWLNDARGVIFEAAYKNWLEENAKKTIVPVALITAQNELITAMEYL